MSGRIETIMALCCVVGCSAAPEPPISPPSTITVPEAPVAPPDPSTVSLAAPTVSNALVDGDLSEWGSLEPSTGVTRPAMTRVRPSGGSREDVEPLPDAQNPRQAASQVGIALHDDRALIAARLGEGSGDTVWIGVGAAAPAVPSLGHVIRGGYTYPIDCEFNLIDLAEGEVRRGEPLKPEEATACRDLVARHTAFTQRHNQRFVRRYRIDPSGVSLVAADGSITLIPAAKVASKTMGSTLTLEASVPVDELPRMADAPVEWLRVSAHTTTGVMPADVSSDSFLWLALPAPVSFDAMGPVRAAMFESVNGAAFFPPALSYQPGDPEHVESVDFQTARSSVGPAEHALYEKKKTMGSIELGVVRAYAEGVAVWKDGKLLDVLLLQGMPNSWGPENELETIVERDGMLHIFVFQPLQWTVGEGLAPPAWSVTAIDKDGQAHADLMVDGEMYEMWHDWESFHDPDYLKVGVRGNYHDFGDEKKHAAESTWTWSPETKKYTATRKTLRSFTKAKPKPKKQK